MLSSFLHSELLDRLSKALCYVEVSLIPISPASDRLPISRKSFELRKWSVAPVDRSKDHWDDPCLPICVFFHRPPQFVRKAVVGRDEVGTHEQENECRILKVSINFVVEMLAGTDFSVVPDGKNATALQDRKMRFERSTKSLVTMRIGDKSFNW